MSDTSSSRSSGSSTPPPRPATPVSVKRLRSLLCRTLRVTIDDGRIFVGTFVGTDKQLNILLVSTEEFRIGADAVDGNPNGRFVGQVMIPWRLVRKVEASGRDGAQRPAEDVVAGSPPESDDILYA
ncbi:uncharacterized protein C8Q71DRAFT_55271 [Rhodofomes roseus]|uniref:Sm domain-containing protein n=1 Tax=Rhodofomes roseus TaxID=34475 RepID=A0A4Y9YIL6_9APHY|nr:uncharacterized protein C8Q71DRAFT_55271 [Rhodofomes roseus]KAH9836708.1 hypothetical protein C8Q71DRAFT_55271 [Rhodofomes roseus]TFY62384.1 hypothetical protein EVJ58_g3886 [Rhodofomes roseus]